MSPKILKKKVSVSSSPFQFQNTQMAESSMELDAEAELDAFEEPFQPGRMHQQQTQNVDMGDLMERAQKDAEAIVSEAKQRAASVERDAYEKGLGEGRKTGEIMAEQQLQAILTQYHSSLTALDQVRELMLNQNQLDFMELVVFTAEKVINSELSLNPGVILPMVKAAMQTLKQRSGLVIFLNGDDHTFVMSMAEAEQQKWFGTQSQVELDAALNRGSFRIETAAGELDASIENQLQQVSQNLAETLS